VFSRNKLAKAAVLVSAIFISSFFVSVASAEGTPISVTAAAEKLEKNELVIIDVREPNETKDGYVKGAILLPTSVMKADEKALAKTLAKIGKGKEIAFYCAKGGRAGRAALQAEKLGAKAYNMGGFSEWADTKLPVSKTK
jgi:rhodanese-related sulfurtransferase